MITSFLNSLILLYHTYSPFSIGKLHKDTINFLCNLLKPSSMCTKAGGIFCATCTKKWSFVQLAQKLAHLFVQNAENVILGNSALCTKAFLIVENFCAVCTSPNSARDVPPRAAKKLCAQNIPTALFRRRGVSAFQLWALSACTHLPRNCSHMGGGLLPRGSTRRAEALFRNCQLKAGADYSFLGASFPYCTYIIPYAWRFVKGFFKNFFSKIPSSSPHALSRVVRCLCPTHLLYRKEVLPDKYAVYGR